MASNLHWLSRRRFRGVIYLAITSTIYVDQVRAGKRTSEMLLDARSGLIYIRRLIAIMLGRLRMNIDHCLAEYTRLQGNISRKFTTTPKLLRPRKANTWPEAELRHLLRNNVKPPMAFRTSACENEGLFASDPERCRTYGDPMSAITLSEYMYILYEPRELTNVVFVCHYRKGRVQKCHIFSGRTTT